MERTDINKNHSRMFLSGISALEKKAAETPITDFGGGNKRSR